MPGEKPVYIHYGHGKFINPRPIANLSTTYGSEVWCFTKPKGGLWASRKDDNNSWKNWCKGQEVFLDRFDTCFEFTLKENAKVVELSNEDQLDDLPKIREFKKEDRFAACYLDFEKLENNMMLLK